MIILLILLLLILVPPCQAEKSSFALGISEYKQEHFIKAAEIFENCIKTGNSSSDLYYYTAVTYERLGDFKKAAENYSYIITNFPNSSTANLASAAIERPTFQQILSTHGLEKFMRNPGLDIYPKETWVGFTRHNNTLIVDGAINNLPTKMIFDTGASGCVFTQEQLSRLGIDCPKGLPNAMTYGVGSESRIPVWTMKVDLKLGKIERKNFPIFVPHAQWLIHS